MDNKIEKTSKIFLILAIISLLIVSTVFGAGILLSRKDSEKPSYSGDEIEKILETKVSTEDMADFSAKVDEISENLDKLESNGFKNEQARAKFYEVKASFEKLKESGKIAKIISKISAGEDVVNELKENEKLKSLGEKLENYQTKLKDIKSKYSGTGEDIQAVLDYSALEAASEDVKVELAKLQNGELSGVTSDEIDAFYGKIEELKEIVSK